MADAEKVKKFNPKRPRLQPAARSSRQLMTKTNLKSGSSYAGALRICQNLARHTAYEVLGDQALVPSEREAGAHPTREIVLMPGVRLASQKMADAIATLGSIALGVRSLRTANGGYEADFTVLFPVGGKAERFEAMRPWLGSRRDLYLIPSFEAGGPSGVCFKFDKGLHKTQRPWTDEEDRSRGLAAALSLLSAEGTDQRSS